MVAHLLLGVAQAGGLLALLLGWPGIWLQVASLALFAWWTGFQAVEVVPLALLAAIAVLAELFVVVVTGGGVTEVRHRPAATAGLVGGTVGVGLGAAYPLLGSLYGALLGALLGSLLAAFGVRAPPAGFFARGAETISMGVRSAAAVVVAAFAILTILR